jgi:hypothetical protein
MHGAAVVEFRRFMKANAASGQVIRIDLPAGFTSEYGGAATVQKD